MWDPQFLDLLMNDINFCQNCQQICEVNEDFTCTNCGENICLICGCTDSEPCIYGCEWSRPGICSECTEEGEIEKPE